jgi:O-antigen/teichoic acid export membrane protein
VSCALALLGILKSAELSDLALHDGGRHANLVALILLAVPLGVTAQIYHSLLAGARAVRALVVTQIVTDVGAMLVFAALIFPFGLTGAIIGFVATHLIALIAKGIAVRRIVGRSLIAPRPREFDWSVVRSNVGYGASGLMIFVMTNLAIMLVSRIIIVRLGVDDNGIFSNAWRLSSVYLFSVTATANAYLLPTLGRCKSDQEMSDEINSALRFYLLILPLPMAAVMAGGELLVWLILSGEFARVAPLLLLFVPAELLRIVSETLAMTLLVRRRMGWFTAVSAGQFVVFMAGSALLVPTMGLKGAALSYFAGYLLGMIANLVLVASFYRVTINPAVQRLALLALFLIGGVGLLSLEITFGPARIFLAAFLSLAWFGIALSDVEARRLVSGQWKRFRGRAAA